MRVLLINPPYQTLTSNLGVGHQAPLGLLMIAGALRDAGNEVELVDAEAKHLSLQQIVQHVVGFQPSVVMSGHAGSTPAHPTCRRLFAAIKAAAPKTITIYGGVYPTYHTARILRDEPSIDFIVRGEGEATAVELLDALARNQSEDELVSVTGIGFRRHGSITVTPDRPPIRDLDAYRVGWELVQDWDLYRCFGLGRAAIVQLSRGCPHRCTYCGQHSFWVSWRHRDPIRVVNDIERLHKMHDVRFITLADENPTTLPEVWRRFLEELAARKLDVYFFATIRASDIVRDEAILHLYRQAGLLYILMGVDTVNGEAQQRIRKGSTLAIDQRACHLLRRNGIFAMLGYIVGFSEQNWAGWWTAARSLMRYDADLLNAMYATPHSWTPFADEQRRRAVVEPDLTKWDYRHQVLAHDHLKPWQVFFAVKFLEVIFHLRPRKVWSWLRANSFIRSQIAWCFLHTGRVWLGEIGQFLLSALRRAWISTGFSRGMQQTAPHEN